MKKSLVKLWHMFCLSLCKDGYTRADYLKKRKVLGNIGENCFWHPRRLPSEADAVYLHNNVQVTADVVFVTHDITAAMLNNIEPQKYKSIFATIEILDNVAIGTGSIILPNVIIGPNVVIAAGSVVTKSFSGGKEGIVIGGNPAKVIHDWSSLHEKCKREKKVYTINILWTNYRYIRI